MNNRLNDTEILRSLFQMGVKPHDPAQDEPESEDELDLFQCANCGCNVARWRGSLGNTVYFNCRNCGYTSYREIL